MKHAYLILAHNEFEVLSKLLQMLDDDRNDIYIHFDRKLKSYPSYTTRYANLFILEDRVDARWGHVSLIKAEYALFEAASQQASYQYYHLLSGTHLPLKSQDYIHSFFNQLRHQEVMIYMSSNDYQIDLKLRRYNFFIKNLMHGTAFVRRLNQLLWKTGIRVQKILHIHKCSDRAFCQASQWVSITNDCVHYLLGAKKEILQTYRYSLCGDEFFIPTALNNSGREWHILNEPKLLDFNIQRANAKVYRMEDYEELINSHCLFARKFSSMEMGIVDKLLNDIIAKK